MLASSGSMVLASRERSTVTSPSGQETASKQNTRRSLCDPLPARALTRPSTGATAAEMLEFLPHLPSKSESSSECQSPILMSEKEGRRRGSAAEDLFKRLRAQAIDDSRSPGAPRALVASKSAGSLTSASQTMDSSKPMLPSDFRSLSKDVKSGLGPKSPSHSFRGSGTLAQRRRLLQPAVLETDRPEQKGIRKIEEGEKIFDLYYWEEVLQESGDGGKVVVCKPKESPKGESFGYVMKIRSKESLRREQHEEDWVRSQIRMLNFTPHAGVMHVREFLEDDVNYYVVMDKAKGGTLFHSLLREYKDKTMPHRAIRNLTREILEAVAHIHSQGILHRDIKPDNLVMQLHDDPASPGSKVKKVTIIDFDHADTEFSPMSPSKRGACYGTARFNPPEAFLGRYSQGSDLYSVGAILYMLVTGYMPYPDEFFERDESEAKSPSANSRWMNEVFDKMKCHQVDWSRGFNDHPLCLDFCQKLMAFDPRQRFSTPEDALAHAWFA